MWCVAGVAGAGREGCGEGSCSIGSAVMADARNVLLSNQNSTRKSSSSEGWHVWRLVNLYCLMKVINVRVGLNIHWNKSTNASYLKSVLHSRVTCLLLSHLQAKAICFFLSLLIHRFIF